MKASGVPTVPGSDGPLNDDPETLKAMANASATRLLLKRQLAAVVVVCAL